MTEQIIAFHVAIVIAYISFGYFTGKSFGFLNVNKTLDIKDNYKYNAYSWIMFLFFTLLVIIYMTYHCFDCITYYNE